MKCRLVLAGEIAKRPKLYLIDEGLGHIDRGALKNFLDFLLGEAKRGVPVIVVSNDLTMGSLFANRIVLMENGTIKFEGDIQSALSDPGVIRATGGNKILNSFMTFHENNRGRKPLSLSELRELIKSETNSDPV
jgi:ABC-type multidrug transport system ATPase subunit